MTCFVGLDVSMEETAFCVRGPEGRILGQGKTATDPDAIAGALAHVGRPARVVLETGRMANWLTGSWSPATSPPSASTPARRTRC